MSDIVDGLRNLDSTTEAEFRELQHRITRTYEVEPMRRDSLAAAVTCANLVATTALARERIARILKLLEIVEARIERSAAEDTASAPKALHREHPS